MKSLTCLLLISVLCTAQAQYPQDYFRSPLDIPIVLAGTFAELRSNHFHSGLDIKTERREGLPIFAAADGYVSRIKISHFGYGKALYITHPNGYTTVYAHLQKLSPALEKYLKECQYEKESFQVEMFPSKNELWVTKGELVAFSGNTGSSSAPHLHYEIRDNQERPINPLLFGIDVPDAKSPKVQGLYAYANTQDSHINGETGRVKLRMIPKGDGEFTTENIKAFGNIGFGVVSYDQQDMADNKNGLWNIQTFFNGSNSLEIDFRRFSFNETKHLNRLIDYQHYKNNRERIQKLFVEANNPLSLYRINEKSGYISVLDSTSSVYKVRLRDYKGNETWLHIPIEGEKLKIQGQIKPIGNSSVLANESSVYENGNYKVYFPAKSFYDDMAMEFSVSGDTLKLHKDDVPLLKSFNIEYKIHAYEDVDIDKLYIAKLYGYYQRPSYIPTQREGAVLKAYTKALGNFLIVSDTINPQIKPLNFQDKKWVSNLDRLKVEISDAESGISEYRATVNGKWILMEYDYKEKMLTHNFDDNAITNTENILKLIVTDNVGNSSTFEATFFRK